MTQISTGKCTLVNAACIVKSHNVCYPVVGHARSALLRAMLQLAVHPE